MHLMFIPVQKIPFLKSVHTFVAKLSLKRLLGETFDNLAFSFRLLLVVSDNCDLNLVHIHAVLEILKFVS